MNFDFVKSMQEVLNERNNSDTALCVAPAKLPEHPASANIR
jgi:hypothetical protein